MGLDLQEYSGSLSVPGQLSLDAGRNQVLPQLGAATKDRAAVWCHPPVPRSVSAKAEVLKVLGCCLMRVRSAPSPQDKSTDQCTQRKHGPAPTDPHVGLLLGLDGWQHRTPRAPGCGTLWPRTRATARLPVAVGARDPDLPRQERYYTAVTAYRYRYVGSRVRH
jgi:hypothetical protein